MEKPSTSTWVGEFLAALLPRRFEFGRRDIPVRPAFLGDGAQVLAEVFESGPTEKPVAVIDLVNDKPRLEDDHVRDHGIVEGIGVFGDVEIFLDHTPRVGEEGPMSADSGAIFARLSDIVGADRDEPTIGDLKLTVELDKAFSLSAVLGAETAAAEDKNHGMRSLQFGQLPVLRCVVGKLIVGEDGPRNDVGSHVGSSTVGCAAPSGVRRPFTPDGSPVQPKECRRKTRSLRFRFIAAMRALCRTGARTSTTGQG
jgi:hypothetical protein